MATGIESRKQRKASTGIGLPLFAERRPILSVRQPGDLTFSAPREIISAGGCYGSRTAHPRAGDLGQHRKTDPLPFALILLLMMLLAGGMMLYFRKRRWI
jgi:hypothetical protein